MKLTMKKWKITLFSLLLALVSLLGVLTWKMGAKTPLMWANAATSGYSGLVMEDGAGIRIVGDTGIRFSASIDEATASSVTEYGMLLSDKDYLNGAELTVDTSKWKISNATGMNTATTEDGKIRFNAVLTNVKDANLTRAYVARAYVKDANGTHYTSVVERSPFAVAVAAYADGYTQTEVKNYMVLDVNIAANGDVSVARDYTTIGGTTITANGNVGATDPTLNNINGAGANFFGLIVNGKRVTMGESSTVEIGTNAYTFTNTSVNNNVFTGVSTMHTHTYNWDDSAADKDIYACACGDVQRTFTKDYTDKYTELDFHTGAHNIETPFESGTILYGYLDGETKIEADGSHLDFSSIVDNLQKHGEHIVTVAVQDGDFIHQAKLAVRLITRTFTSASEKNDFKAATRGVHATCTADNPLLYGYYVLAVDLDAAWGSSGYDELYSATLPEKNTYGFAGTIIGRKADGSAPVITTTPRSGGIFGYLVGATIKNIEFKDIYYRGSASAGPVLSTIAIDTTLEDVTFRITAVNTDAGEQKTSGWGYGWIINNEIRNVTFKNVNFVNATSNTLELGRLLTDQNDRKVTFENCAISENLTVTNVYGTTAISSVTGIDFKGHIHTYAYVADAAGHIAKCTVCGGTATREEHYGGSANCGGGAKCAVCGTVYTGATTGVHTNFVWNKQDGKDVYWCEGCHTVQKEVRTDYTDVILSVDFGAGETSVDLPLAGHGTLRTAVLMGVGSLSDEQLAEGKVSLTHVDFSDYASKLQQHGERDLKVIVDNEGHEHEIHFTVRLITRTFKAGEEAAFREATRGVSTTCTADNPKLYGCYVLATDIDTRWSTNSYVALYSNNGTPAENRLPASDQYGFAGTIVGDKGNGVAPVIKATSKSGGIFGYLVGATIKNVIIEEEEHVGTYYASGTNNRPIFATVAKNVTLENVTFTVKSLNTNYGGQAKDGWGIAWIVNNTVSNMKFINVNFVNETGSTITVGRMIPGAATFTNCNVVDITFTLVYNTVSVDGLTKVDHIHTYKYVGTESGHIGTCTECQATTAEEKHYGGVATCTEKGVCVLCGYAYISAGSGAHEYSSYISDGENHYLVCSDCGAVNESSGEAHYGGTATCASGEICEVCHLEYGTPSENHSGTFAWKVGEYADEYACSVCGATTDTFHTNYTSDRLEVDGYQTAKLNLSSYFASGASASNISFNGVALSGTLSAIDFSGVTDLSKHGDHELTVTVTVNGQAHDVKFSVRLITRSFGENEQADLAAVARGIRTSDKTSIYGFYRITADLNCRTNQGFTELWSGGLPENYYGFAGTIYGEKADGSAPVLSVQSKNGGTFGYLVGATFENLIFEDIYYRGSSMAGAAVMGSIAHKCTFNNVTFRVKALNAGTDAAFADLSAINVAQENDGWGYGWLVSNETKNCTFTDVIIESAVTGVHVGRIFGGNNGANTTATENEFTNVALMGVTYDRFIGFETSVEGVFSPVNVIVVDVAEGASEPSKNLVEMAYDLQGILKKATGLSWIVEYENKYSTENAFVNKIVLGNVEAFSDTATMTANAKALGGASYAMKADGTTVYLCGANDYGIENAIYEFLDSYFGYEMYSPSYSVINAESWNNESTLVADKVPNAEEGVQQAFLNNGYRSTLTSDAVQQMRYNGDVAVELLMSVEEGVHASKVHNAFYWLPVNTYKKDHSKWYAKEEVEIIFGATYVKQQYNELCYTAQGDSNEYQAMIAACVEVAKAAVAFPENEGKYYLPFLKNDATSACVCDACKAMESQYGSKSATVVKFMNDLMAAIEADSEITRKDFDLVFFAYEDFEVAPTGMTLDDRVTVWLTTPYTFNYQKNINDATDDINVAGKANLINWKNMSTSGDLWLWMYSTNFNNLMLPVDTFEFYDEDAYAFFRENGVTMMYSQSQTTQTGTMTAWHNLKMYLDGQLMKNPETTQEALIAKYMAATYGPAAEAMTNFFNSVREYTKLSNHSELNSYYANNKYGAYTLLAGESLEDKKYWDKSKVEEWLGYCDAAYAAIESLQTTNVAEYNRIKTNIDIEWISPAYISVMLKYNTGLKSELLNKVNEFGMTRYRELEADLVEHIG